MKKKFYICRLKAMLQKKNFIGRSFVLMLLLSVASAAVVSAHPKDTVKRGGPGISIRTNLLWDAAAEPNLGLEFAVGDHWSVGVDGGIKTWPRWLFWDNDNTNDTRHWRNFAVVPEVRYYLNEVYRGFFAGADFVYTHYNVGDVKFPLGLYPETRENRVQGSFWGGGLLAGYAWWPWQHWRLEAELGVAAGLAAYDRYDCAHCGTKLAEERKPAVVPKLALNVAYNPVARDKRQPRTSVVYSGTDTLTVFTPPVAFVVQLKDVKAPESTGDRLAGKNHWVIPFEKYRPLDYLTRPGRDSLQYVHFPVNGDRLDLSLSDNADALSQIRDAIVLMRDDERTADLLVTIVGLSSIDGPQEKNDTLSVRRARSVASWLSEQTGVGLSHFETIGKGEAWDWFRDQLEANPEGNEKLLDIVNNEPDPDKRESLIKADAKLYKQVKEQFLADQRNSGYIRVYYEDAPDPATEKLNGEVMDLLNTKRYHDAVRAIQADKALLERVRSDAEAMNAYGVALYFTALDKQDERQEQEALGLLRQAARAGSQAALQNLEGMETYGPARKDYEAWKELMKNDK